MPFSLNDLLHVSTTGPCNASEYSFSSGNIYVNLSAVVRHLSEITIT